MFLTEIESAGSLTNVGVGSVIRAGSGMYLQPGLNKRDLGPAKSAAAQMQHHAVTCVESNARMN